MPCYARSWKHGTCPNYVLEPKHMVIDWSHYLLGLIKATNLLKTQVGLLTY